MSIFFNGRFLAAPDSGVQRTARQLILHLDRRLVRSADRRNWRLLHPRGAEPMTGLAVIRHVELDGPQGQLWEQVSLGRAARDGVLVNLANTAPIGARRSIVLVHDAQVWDTPASYSRAFRLWYRFLLPRVCSSAARVLSVSRYSANRLAANGVVGDANTVGVVFNGVDHFEAITPEPGVLAKHGLGERPFLLGFASAQPHKNTALLLQVAAKLPAYDMALVGNNLPAGLAVSGQVKLLGRMSDAELMALYVAAFAFLSPSTTEGFGLPVGEAMLCGAPAIISGAGALGEVWGPGAAIAPPDQPAAWVAAIKKLAASEQARAAQAQAGRDLAKTYTWDAAAATLLREIDGVAG